jgi:hypothetical protein
VVRSYRGRPVADEGKFDGALEDVFALQDQVTASVVGLIAPKLEQAEIERARQKPTDRLDSYDLYLRGNATGTKVAIGDHKGIVGRVAELHGQDVICITPDEVAVMVGTVASIEGIAAIRTPETDYAHTRVVLCNVSADQSRPSGIVVPEIIPRSV